MFVPLIRSFLQLIADMLTKCTTTNEIGEEVGEVVRDDTCISVIQSLQLCKAKVDGSEVARFLNRTSILNKYVVQ